MKPLGSTEPTRVEKDSMGEMPVPNGALWGASTQRAVLNFPISGHPVPAAFISGLGLLKAAAAQANEDLGRLPAWKSRLIQQAAREIAAGSHASQFPVDIFQSGSGTSTNTNANEVIARRAAQLGGGSGPEGGSVHPNDDVNLGQSSNDVIPTALHLSVAVALQSGLLPALDLLAGELEKKSGDFSGVVKIGRTHLMDATPLTLGQEFSGYAAQVRKACERVRRAIDVLGELAIGGTAVGTGLNAHPDFSARVCRILSAEVGIAFREARNHFEAQAARDDSAEVAGVLAAVSASLTKIANDLRLLSSGPRAGLGELRLPATQPGSSIMPGKVNPVMSEMLVQVCLYVQGLVQTVLSCCREGQLELNATLPLIAYCLHEAIACLSSGARAFAERCVRGIEADAARCQEFVERSLMLVAALNPHIGYDAGARVAKEALSSGRSVRDVVLALGLMEEGALGRALDPLAMTRPSAE
jgi:fumarate hydratase class II